MSIAAGAALMLYRMPHGRAPEIAQPASHAARTAVEQAATATVVEQAPAVTAAPPPAAPPAVATTSAAPSSELELAPLVLEPPAKAEAPTPPVEATAEAATPPGPPPTAVRVTVKSIPDGAIFFEAGRRIGAGTIHIDVEHRVKHHLTALLNGYQPLNFKIDGSRATLAVRLTPIGVAPQPDDVDSPPAKTEATPSP